jgi:hypothetical protein
MIGEYKSNDYHFFGKPKTDIIVEILEFIETPKEENPADYLYVLDDEFLIRTFECDTIQELKKMYPEVFI